MSGRVTLRRASVEDCRFYWLTNNDPTVRAQSISSAPIPYEDHLRWYASRCEDPTTWLLIAELDGRAIGVARCDLHPGDAEVSLALAPDARGRGAGTAVIAGCVSLLLQASPDFRITARVRPDNGGSLRAFARAGFRHEATTHDRGVDLALLVYVGDTAPSQLERKS